MFTRDLRLPRGALFLFGPRGTGKSTWVRTMLPDAFVVNLLPPDTMLVYERQPSQFRAEVLAQPQNRWIVIDEVQRVPKLLDEVHWLMEEKGYKRFALTGSSARKVKRDAANLLAGPCGGEEPSSPHLARSELLRASAPTPALRLAPTQRDRRRRFSA